MFLTATIRDDNGKSVGVIVLSEREFKSGSVGFHGQAKLEIDGRRHQCQVQMQAVEIGSKPKGGAGDAEGEG